MTEEEEKKDEGQIEVDPSYGRMLVLLWDDKPCWCYCVVLRCETMLVLLYVVEMINGGCRAVRTVTNIATIEQTWRVRALHTVNFCGEASLLSWPCICDDVDYLCLILLYPLSVWSLLFDQNNTTTYVFIFPSMDFLRRNRSVYLGILLYRAVHDFVSTSCRNIYRHLLYK